MQQILISLERGLASYGMALLMAENHGFVERNVLSLGRNVTSEIKLVTLGSTQSLF